MELRDPPTGKGGGKKKRPEMLHCYQRSERGDAVPEKPEPIGGLP